MNKTLETTSPRPHVGISACLLGQPVRYDGGHKGNRFLMDALSEFFDWIPVCPEVEMGMGTPREAIRLVQLDEGLSLRGTKSGANYTEQMKDYAHHRLTELKADSLRGYVLKKDSPSCGLHRVKVYAGDAATRSGRGVFAAALVEAFPNLPVEEEGRLCDPRLRENWVERVFAYDDLCRLWSSPWEIGDLVAFHSRYKLSLLAHSESEHRQLGRLVAGAKGLPRKKLRERYESMFMSALGRISTRRTNTNVLQHILGFFKRQLTRPARNELVAHVEAARDAMTAR